VRFSDHILAGLNVGTQVFNSVTVQKALGAQRKPECADTTAIDLQIIKCSASKLGI